MDPRNHWSSSDWAIADAYFNMIDCKPPGESYVAFYRYTSKNKPVTQPRVLKTIKEIVKYKKWNLTKRDICISKKISKLWRRIYNMDVEF